MRIFVAPRMEERRFAGGEQSCSCLGVLRVQAPIGVVEQALVLTAHVRLLVESQTDGGWALVVPLLLCLRARLVPRDPVRLRPKAYQ